MAQPTDTGQVETFCKRRRRFSFSKTGNPTDRQTSPMLRPVLKSSLLAIASGLSLLLSSWLTRPAHSAEQVIVNLGNFEIALAVDDLETYANTGEVRGGLKLYSRFLGETGMAELRQFLQRRFEVNPVVISQLLYSSLGEETLRRLGAVVRTDTRQNGFSAIRAAAILAANQPEGLSIIGWLRQYPSYSIRLNAQQLLELRQQFSTQIDYRDAVVRAINEAAAAEALQSPLPATVGLPDPGQPGPYGVDSRTLEFSRDRQTLLGDRVPRPFRVLLRLPRGLARPAPVVVISHGLGSTPEAFAYLGDHFASHGFVAILPQHIGSDESRRTSVLAGVLTSPVTPVEFVDRPLDITYVLDTLGELADTDPALTGRMDLQRVAVLGHSFGGYTALALAGASLNTGDLFQQECARPQARLDVSLVLQCSASRLPPYTYTLRDPRVQAAIAVSPLTNPVFGPQGLGQIQVPVMLMSGSNDFIASAVPQQIHPFLWLTTPKKYLAVMVPSSHTFADNTPSSSSTLDTVSLLLSGPSPRLGQEYVRELSLAFLQTHLNNQPAYEAFLTATYAASISEEPLDLRLVRSLSAEQLEQAFGGPPPIPFVPEVTAQLPGDRPGSVIEAIAQSGVLRAAVQPNSPPFGVVNSTGELSGYCVDLLNRLTQQLQAQLDRPIRLDLSTADVTNRFELVQTGAVQIECGPNTLRSDIEGVLFSAPFFLTGVQLLIDTNTASQFNPSGTLAGARIGVLRDTVTEQVIRQRYPAAQIVALRGAGARTAGFQALRSGAIDLFAGDGVLLLGEALQSSSSLSEAGYTLLPPEPLSCDPYAMLLPATDSAWRSMVNTFLTSQSARQVGDRWFTQDLRPYLFLTLDRCVAE